MTWKNEHHCCNELVGAVTARLWCRSFLQTSWQLPELVCTGAGCAAGRQAWCSFIQFPLQAVTGASNRQTVGSGRAQGHSCLLLEGSASNPLSQCVNQVKIFNGPPGSSLSESSKPTSIDQLVQLTGPWFTIQQPAMMQPRGMQEGQAVPGQNHASMPKFSCTPPRAPQRATRFHSILQQLLLHAEFAAAG